MRLLVLVRYVPAIRLNESPHPKAGKYAVLEDGKVILSEPQ